MPGGKIAFFYGILSKLQLDDDEVAAIMGHEVSHALLEHARERMGKTTATRLGIELGAAIFGLGNAGRMAGDLGGQLLTLKFSRDDESEADSLGLILARQGRLQPARRRDAVAEDAAGQQGRSAAVAVDPPVGRGPHPRDRVAPAERAADLCRGPEAAAEVRPAAEGQQQRHRLTASSSARSAPPPMEGTRPVALVIPPAGRWCRGGAATTICRIATHHREPE